VDVLRVEDAKTEGIADLTVCAEFAVVWVVGVDRIRLVLCIWGRLPIWCLGLHIASKDVFGTGELILVESMVLYTVAIEPNIGTFDEEAAASEDRDTSAVEIIQVVISRL
jgi:hypothetical protein